MKTKIAVSKLVLPVAACAVLFLSGCAGDEARSPAGTSGVRSVETSAENAQTAISGTVAAGAGTSDSAYITGKGAENTEMTLSLSIDGKEVAVAWEDNASVRALAELCGDAPVVIRTSAYGGFEQVGPIGRSLPSSDVRTSTDPGDIVLYSGNRIVVFYGRNSWSYTRLGKITAPTGAGLTEILEKSGVTLTFSLK